MSYEYQATLHAIGEPHPPHLDGWTFLGWSIHDHGGGPFCMARWRRRLA